MKLGHTVLMAHYSQAAPSYLVFASKDDGMYLTPSLDLLLSVCGVCVCVCLCLLSVFVHTNTMGI
jgi:hypothetical protein